MRRSSGLIYLVATVSLGIAFSSVTIAHNQGNVSGAVAAPTRELSSSKGELPPEGSWEAHKETAPSAQASHLDQQGAAGGIGGKQASSAGSEITLAESRPVLKADPIDLGLADPSLSLDANAENTGGGIESHARRKLLQFGYDLNLLDEIFVTNEIRRLQTVLATTQARIQFLTNFYNSLYQASLAFSPGGALNPFGRRLLSNKLLETNLAEASQGLG